MLWKMLHERSRSRAVRNLGVLGTPLEPAFNRFVVQAASAFAAPISLLTVLHDQQLLVKASTGLEMECLPRKDGFCNYAVDRGDLLEVCDALADPFFRTLPCVTGEPRVRYYLGAPLTLTHDIDIGILCVIDTVPRPPTSRDQRSYLIELARQAADAIERRADFRNGRAA